jgi:hypothetical protein
MGHSKDQIASHLGVTHSEVYQLVKRTTIRQSTLDALHDVYLQLRDTPGRSTQTLWRARRAGQHPPMCWDDESIDDRDAEPYDAACVIEHCTRPAHRVNLCRAHHERLGQRDYRKYVLAENKKGWTRDTERFDVELRELMEFGLNAEQISERLGREQVWIEKRIRRINR